MNKFYQAALVLAYITATAIPVLWVLNLWGIHLSNSLGLLLITSWTAICFTAAYWLTGFFIARLNVRLPIREEEDLCRDYFEEVRQRANCPGPFRILILESREYSAFAIGRRTIVISREILEKMSRDEVRAIFAHELGHLVSRDCIMATAFGVANYLPGTLAWFYSRGKILFPIRFLFRLLNPFRGWIGFILLAGLSYVVYTRHLLFPILALMLLLRGLPRANRLFLFLWKAGSRYTEYKQDAYAHRLGYGTTLRQVLYKLAQAGPQTVALSVILMHGSHPVIYNRIRRLEKLEGLR